MPFSQMITRGLVVAGLFISTFANAGVFSTPHFVTPGEFAMGIEPELTLTNGAGIAANFRYTQGISDLNNATIILGTGSGPRKFRLGGNFTFDFFPDTKDQPGIGIAAQGIYYRGPSSGLLEITAVPYIHKTYLTANHDEFEPFFSFPFGMNFSGGQYQAASTFVLGTMVKATEKLRYVMEVGVAVNHTESYVSGGVMYYH